MDKKLQALFSSIRFWIVTLTAATAILENYVGGGAIEAYFDIVQVWLATVAGIGTLDSVAQKFGMANTNQPTVFSQVDAIIEKDGKVS